MSRSTTWVHLSRALKRMLNGSKNEPDQYVRHPGRPDSDPDSGSRRRRRGNALDNTRRHVGRVRRPHASQDKPQLSRSPRRSRGLLLTVILNALVVVRRVLQACLSPSASSSPHQAPLTLSATRVHSARRQDRPNQPTDLQCMEASIQQAMRLDVRYLPVSHLLNL